LKLRDIRKKTGNQIRAIRYQYDNDRGRRMTQQEFADLYNSFDPVEIKTDAQSVGQYERGDVSVPGDKLSKFLLMDKED
jgi:hypothetical protein